MKFGKVEDPGQVDFTIPKDHPDTKRVLKKHKKPEKPFEVFVGCAKWNKKDLKGFYPRGTKDELTYYSRQFNSIELNATFYNSPEQQQVLTWKGKTPDDFKFFPKIPQTVSHYKRLKADSQMPLEEFCDAIAHFEDQLGMAFLQMHNNFKPKDFDRVERLVKEFPAGIPWALEVRNEEWFEGDMLERYTQLLEQQGVTNVLVDTAGRRDMMHMRLTSPTAFVRYVGANHPSDYARLDEWLERIVKWREEGLQHLYFFVHQNLEKESPLLSAYFIQRLNKALDLDVRIPQLPNHNALGF